MNDCDIRSPFWKRSDCPGNYDASHICRACQLQKASKKRVEYVIQLDVEAVYDLAASLNK